MREPLGSHQGEGRGGGNYPTAQRGGKRGGGGGRERDWGGQRLLS